MRLEFEWDDTKAQKNKKKHGISFEEAATVFSDTLGLITFDRPHSEKEDRYVIIGESDKERLLIVVFMGEGNRIRIISSREATRRERKNYEEGNKR